jgi:hypothetical protein
MVQKPNSESQLIRRDGRGQGKRQVGFPSFLFVFFPKSRQHVKVVHAVLVVAPDYTGSTVNRCVGNHAAFDAIGVQWNSLFGFAAFDTIGVQWNSRFGFAAFDAINVQWNSRFGFAAFDAINVQWNSRFGFAAFDAIGVQWNSLFGFAAFNTIGVQWNFRFGFAERVQRFRMRLAGNGWFLFRVGAKLAFATA